jgi:hypothetical protein
LEVEAVTWATLTSGEKAEAVRARIDAGESYGQTAAALGTTRTAVAGVVYRARTEGNIIRRVIIRKPKMKKIGSAGGRTAVTQQKARNARAKAKPHQGVTRYVALDAPPDVVDTAPLRSKAWQALEGSTPKRLSEHRHGECLWAVAESPFQFCCLPVQPGKQYCERHYAISNRPVVQGASTRRQPKPLKGLTS